MLGVCHILQNALELLLYLITSEKNRTSHDITFFSIEIRHD